MGYPVSYYCPNCGTLVELEREGYLSDKAVTPYPFEGWEYAEPDGTFEDGAADGVAFVCGESPPADPDDDGCGGRFYLSFVRFEDGVEVDPRHADTDAETVELAEGRGPDSPRGPDGPSGPTGGFY